jgi:UDP-glucuronate 4-epimerase
MNILVTGGAGFIGSHLVEKLLSLGHAVSVLDDFNEFYDPLIKRDNLSAVVRNIQIHEVDLRNSDRVKTVLLQGRYDAVVHLAARAGVRPSIAEPRLYLDTNITGTFNLLDAAHKTGVKRFVFGSSSSVYGLCRQVPFREDQCLLQTISPYAATKLAGEHLCSNYAHLHQMRVVCLRFFTVYGPRQRPDLAIHDFTKRIFAGQPIRQFGDGSTARDYTYVTDIVDGITAALSYEEQLFDIFNLGGSQTTTLAQLIRLIEQAAGKTALVEKYPEQPGDVPLTYADISKAGRLLGYSPKVPVSQGIANFTTWFQERYLTNG